MLMKRLHREEFLHIKKNEILVCLAYHQIVKKFAAILEPAEKGIWESPAPSNQTEECSGREEGRPRTWKQHAGCSNCLETCFWKFWGACALEAGEQRGLKIGWKEVRLILFMILWYYFSLSKAFHLWKEKEGGRGGRGAFGLYWPQH